jgi:hypothetical protein
MALVNALQGELQISLQELSGTFRNFQELSANFRSCRKTLKTHQRSMPRKTAEISFVGFVGTR